MYKGQNFCINIPFAKILQMNKCSTFDESKIISLFSFVIFIEGLKDQLGVTVLVGLPIFCFPKLLGNSFATETFVRKKSHIVPLCFLLQPNNRFLSFISMSN